MSAETLQRYEDEVLSQVDGRRPYARALRHVAEGPIYGAYIPDIIRAVVSGENLAGSPMQAVREATPTQLAEAVHAIVSSFWVSNTLYFKGHPNLRGDARHREAMKQMQDDVRSGKIRLCDDQYAWETTQGIAQAKHADRLFGSRPPMVQRLAGEINYGLSFTEDTMEGGVAIMQNPDSSLAEWSEDMHQRSMPHVKISNLVMGQLTGEALNEAQRIGLSSALVLDTGTGTGGTQAATILGIEQATEHGLDPTSFPVRMHGIEGCYPFYKQLEGLFLPTVRERVQGLMIPPEVVFGEIVDQVKRMKAQFEQQREGGLVIVTANYVWHRLSTVQKQNILDTLSESAGDLILFVSDLVQNASVVNRRYFNFSYNGPLNCGNIGLQNMCEQRGFKVLPVDQSTAPSSAHQGLIKNVQSGTTSDAVSLIVYKGEKAEQIVKSWQKE